MSSVESEYWNNSIMFYVLVTMMSFSFLIYAGPLPDPLVYSVFLFAA